MRAALLPLMAVHATALRFGTTHAAPRCANRHAAPPRATNAVMGLFDVLLGRESGASSGVPRGYVKASHILLPPSPEAEAEAEALRARIVAGEISFGDAAEQFSACPSKGQRGVLGSFTSLSRILFLPYEGKELEGKEFDALCFSPPRSDHICMLSLFSQATPLGEIQTVTTAFGTHLVVVAERG